MKRKKLYTKIVSTALSPTEYRELERYVRMQENKSTSSVLRDLLVPMIRARVTAQSDDGPGR